MTWDPITESELNPGFAVLKHMRQAWNCLKYLYGKIGAASVAGGVSNGSFEVDSDADGIPDGWTFSGFPGGSGTVDTSSYTHGAQAFKFTHPGGAGNGGGYLDSDYLPVSEFDFPIPVKALVWSSNTSMVNYVQVSWYNQSKIPISGVTIWNGSAPSTPTMVSGNAYPPSTARFAKIRLIGGYTSGSIAGSTWFDDVQFGGNYVSNTQIFTSSGTWTKPVNGATMAKIECWGGGGGGDWAYAAGGGGEYSTTTIPLSSLPASVSVIVGSGGSQGGTGGTSSFGGYLSAAGGERGLNQGIGGGYSEFSGGRGGTSESSPTPLKLTYSGGGGMGTAGGTQAVSRFGGSGSAAASGNGNAPGGGAGQQSGTGGRGEVRVTVW